MKIALPDIHARLHDYTLSGKSITETPLAENAARKVFAAAHVSVNPTSSCQPGEQADIDWKTTLAYRRYLAGLGLGIAEGMDTAQRGMGLNYKQAMELIAQTKKELPDALVFNGAGTDQLQPFSAKQLQDICVAYAQQVEKVQALGGRVILMASRELARLARGSEDYLRVYHNVLDACEQPVILHWLGDMFDPLLKGYWGADIPDAMQTVLSLIGERADKIDGIKISLLDKDKEIQMRRLLPANVSMYSGDDFHYPELIAGDEQGYSDALLGIFDPLAPLAAAAVRHLADGDTQRFRNMMNPSVPLAREIFRPPTQYYKTGVVFLAWLNGFQEHFIMLSGAQSMRPLPYFVNVFTMADGIGLLKDPELAVHRMKKLLAMYGL